MNVCDFIQSNPTHTPPCLIFILFCVCGMRVDVNDYELIDVFQSQHTLVDEGQVGVVCDD